METTHKKGTSVHQIVTDRILAELRRGVVPWEKPWIAGTSAPMNYVSREPYKGINRLLLPKPGEYLTPRQLKALDGTPLENADKHLVTFFTVQEKKTRKRRSGKKASEDNPDEETGTETTENIRVFKYYQVYHLSSVEGVPSKLEAVSENGDFMTHDAAAEAVIRSWTERSGVRVVRSNGDRAAYNADTDTVTVPLLRQFHNSESYYAVLFHELVHSTGTEQRLGRKVSVSAYADDEFTFEQLTAEIGSAMLMSHCGLDTLKVIRDSAARIAGWIGALEADCRLITNASRAAEKAVTLILGTAA